MVTKLRSRKRLVPRSQSLVQRPKEKEFFMYCIECMKKAEFCIPHDPNIIHCADHAKPESVGFSVVLETERP